MNSEEYSYKIADHEDWKDGMNTFKSKISKEITEIYQSIAKLETLTLKVVKYLTLQDDIDELKSDNEFKLKHEQVKETP